MGSKYVKLVQVVLIKFANMSEVVDFPGEQEDAFSDSAIEGEYNFNNTQRTSEPVCELILFPYSV